MFQQGRRGFTRRRVDGADDRDPLHHVIELDDQLVAGPPSKRDSESGDDSHEQDQGHGVLDEPGLAGPEREQGLDRGDEPAKEDGQHEPGDHERGHDDHAAHEPGSKRPQ
ncbi:hypothetical protein RH831_03630 [Halodesulfurarchaeum sp. HSR-GB]|nr:hypothetical protein [Halodesulfurarchaeum sp. HSR-GB]MDR5656270.1 hypothetical protein [Halodesulfurarchaeum sp. HSR-GB]